MSEKPEGISQEATDEAMKLAFDCLWSFQKRTDWVSSETEKQGEMKAAVAIARAIMAAVAAEREACASLAETIGIPRVSAQDRILMVPVEIAAAIRQRGE